MLGAADMAFPRLNALSFWLPADRRDHDAELVLHARRRLRLRLDGLRDALLEPPADRRDLLQPGSAVGGASSIMTALNFLVTIITMRAPG
jgi:cytochrome c oxidase subunit 1